MPFLMQRFPVPVLHYPCLRGPITYPFTSHSPHATQYKDPFKRLSGLLVDGLSQQRYLISAMQWYKSFFESVLKN